MFISEIKIENFRNIDFIGIFPDKKINVIYGENGQGKTNLLESIWLFTGCKSFRTSKDTELVNFNFENSKVSIEFELIKLVKSTHVGERNIEIFYRWLILSFLDGM